MRPAACRRGVALAAAAAAGVAALLALAAQAQPPLPGQAPGGAAAAMPEARATRHALIITIGEYLDAGVPLLRGMGHDLQSARRMALSMGIPPEQTHELRDGEATAARIRAEIQALTQRMRAGDRVFVYYSGHGTRFADPAEAGRCTEGLLASDSQVLTNGELARALAPLAQRADKMLVFYDACHSGGLAEAPLRTRSLQLGGETLTPKFSRAGAPDACGQPANFRTRGLGEALRNRDVVAGNVVHVAASRPDEVSFDSSTRGGYATAAWRDCLLGEALDADGSGAVTAEEVTACAQRKLDQALAAHPGVTGQHMTLAGNRSFVPAWMAAPAAVGPGAPASGKTVAAGTPAQLLAELHEQRDASRTLAVRPTRERLRIGTDPLELTITSPRDGWLYLALAGSDGKSLYLLFPNDLAADNRVRAGQVVKLPGRGWEMVAGGPPGTETLLALVSDAPRDLRGLPADKAGPFLRTLQDARGRARLQAVLANGTPNPQCSRDPGSACSDAFASSLIRLQAVR